MSHPPVTVVIAGIGGYGFYYLQELWDHYGPDEVRLAGVVDPAAEKSGHFQRIRAGAVPIFQDMESFYRTGHRADLAIIVSPIHFHAAQSMTALREGSRVLCDKPLCATMVEADAMIAAEQEAGSKIMVGYQWSWSNAVQKLKQDLISGVYGRPLLAKSICLWPRGIDYYKRNTWAGAVTAGDGRPVYDSPANNAAAHFLHNLLFLLGEVMQKSAEPLRLEADLRRAYPIENFDTIACRIVTRECPEVLFYASHVTQETLDPQFEIVCERGTLLFTDEHREIIAKTPDGGSLIYGTPDADQFKKLHDAITAARKPTQTDPPCGAAAARAQTMCIDLIQKKKIKDFPQERIHRNDHEQRLYVEGLGKTLRDCYHSNSILSEPSDSRRNT